MKRFALLIMSALVLVGCAAHYNQAGWDAFSRGDYLEAEVQWYEGVKNNAAGSYTGIGVLFDPNSQAAGSSNKSIELAVSFYATAAQMGEPLAMNNLALLLIEHGNDEDRQAGIEYLTVSARLGFSKAVENLRAYNLPIPDNDLQRAKLNNDINTIAAIFGLLAIAHTPAPVAPIQNRQSSITNQQINVTNDSGCASDLACSYGQTCVKEIGRMFGTCMVNVDSNKLPVLTPPSTAVEIRSHSDKACKFNSDCPIGFGCDQRLFVCVTN